MSTHFEGIESRQKRVRRAHPLIAAAVSLLLGGPGLVHAADAPAADAPGPVATPAADKEKDKDKVTEVIVTGSRIVRRDFESQSPIVTVNASALEDTSAVGIETVLNRMPQFNVSGTQSSLSSAQNPFPSSTGTPGAATLDLRGMGVNRSLVLLDGQRAQPINAQLAIDINTIPTAAIESIETITGGAASTYGADAIAGVVNFKLKKNFQGIQLDAQYGMSGHGDDQETQLSALIGTNFADNKGNVMLALSYARRGGANGVNRDWVQAGYNDPGTQGGSPPLSSFVVDAMNSPAGGAWLGQSPAAYVDQTGHVFDINHPLNPDHPYTGPLGGGSGYKINPNGSLGWNNEQYDPLQIPMTRWSAFGKARMALNDHLNAYIQLNMSSTRTSYTSGSASALESLWGVNVPYNSAYDNPGSPTFGNGPEGTTYHPVPPQLAALLDSRPNPGAPWTYNGSLTYLPGFTELNTSDVYQLTAGLTGDVPGTDWTWEAFGSHGFTNGVEQQPNGYPQLTRLQELFSANMYGQNFTNPYPIAVTGACTSGLPVFTATGAVNSASSISQNCADWILLRMNTVTQLTQQVAEGDLQGSLVDMPFNAGRLRFAVGLDYRSEDLDFNPDSGYNANQDSPLVVQNIVLPVALTGHTDVSEAYVEFSIPVVKDLPFFKSFEIDPGYRYSRYNTAGGVSTFKILGDWTVNNYVKFRGGLEVANRAPNIAELFTPLGGSQLAVGYDPCAVYPQTPTWGNSAQNTTTRRNVQALCQYLITRDGGPADIMVPDGTANAYQYNFNGYSPNAFPFALALSQGNPALKSETARTITAGAVFHMPSENPLLARTTLSVDWYHIQLDGAIGTPDFTTVYQECLDPHYNSLVGAPYGTYTGAQMAANNPYCAFINREYAPQAKDFYGAVRNYNAQYINQGGIRTSGIDAELDWAFQPADIAKAVAIPGTVGLSVIGSYLQEYAVSPFSGATYIDYTGTDYGSSYYRYKLYTTLSYSVGSFSGGLTWQHLPSLAAAPGSAPDTLGVNAYNLYNLSARYQITDSVEVRGGIDNLFDKWPEWVGAVVGTNNAVGTTDANYDTLGRRFYLGLKMKF